MASRPNWPEIQRRYVEGLLLPDGTRSWPSQGEIAALSNVSRESLNRRARAEGWEQLRHSFITAASQQRQEQAARILAKEAAKVDVSAHRAAGRLIAQVIKHLDIAERENKPIPADRLQSLMRTVALGQQVDQLATGMPTSIQQQHVLTTNQQVRQFESAFERLSPLEQERAARAFADIVRVQQAAEDEQRGDSLH